MKRNTLLLILALFANELWAQPYLPVLGQTNEWRVTSCFGGCITDAYYTAADTVVDGLTYFILGGFHFLEGNFLVREDIQERKVFLKLLGGHHLLDEFPLYDFSLNIGDSVHVYNPLSPMPVDGGKYVLDSIVSNLLELQEHRFFYLHAVDPIQSAAESTVWVEGVGSLSLINTPGKGPNPDDHLSCAFKDGTLQYASSDTVNACSVLGVPQSVLVKGPLVYPNPSNGLVQLNYNGNLSPISTQLTSVDGKAVAEFPWQSTLELTHLQPGFYLLKVEYAEGYLSVSRLLLQRGLVKSE